MSLRRCSYCGSHRHPTSHYPKTYSGSARNGNMRCTYCGSRDHNYEACTKHHGGGKLPGAVRIIQDEM